MVLLLSQSQTCACQHFILFSNLVFWQFCNCVCPWCFGITEIRKTLYFFQLFCNLVVENNWQKNTKWPLRMTLKFLLVNLQVACARIHLWFFGPYRVVFCCSSFVISAVISLFTILRKLASHSVWPSICDGSIFRYSCIIHEETNLKWYFDETACAFCRKFIISRLFNEEGSIPWNTSMTLLSVFIAVFIFVTER